MKIKLQENERIDDLNCKGLQIIQNTEGFCFGIDSVLISNFAKEIKKDVKVLDLGTGTGIIPTLLCAKTELSEVVGIEIQREVCEMANRSIELNQLEKRFSILCDTITNLPNYYQNNSFDVVIANPPYKKRGTGIKNENQKKLISRHEVEADLEDFIRITKRMLKDKGEFYLVHRPERLVDIFSLMRKYHIEPKVLQMVSPKKGEPANLVLIKGIKNGKIFLTVKPELFIYQKEGIYTEEVLKIYDGN